MYYLRSACTEPESTYTCSLYTISREWDASEATWHNADSDSKWEDTDPITISTVNPDGIKGGGDHNPECIGTAKTVKAKSWEHYTIETSVMEKIIKEQNSFYGFIIVTYYNCKGRHYCSSEEIDTDKRPKLTIKFKTTGIVNMISAKKSNDKILVVTGSETVNLFIPFQDSYTISILDLKGRQIVSLKGNTARWFFLSRPLFSQGMHIIKTYTEDKITYNKLFFLIH